MRRIIMRMLRFVTLASVVCIVAILFLFRNINTITKQYEERFSHYVQNEENIIHANEAMYHMEALMMLHVSTQDEALLQSYEEKIETLKEEMTGYIDALEEGLVENDDKEMLHQISKNYNRLSSYIDVAIGLSRDGAIQSAQYYMDKIADSLEDTESIFRQMKLDLENRNAQAAKRMEHSMTVARWEEIFCIVIVGIIIITCMVIVFRNGHLIVYKQELEDKDHQQRIMNIQYSTIVGMANLIESRDLETGEHVKRTGKFVDLIAKELAKNSIYANEIDTEFLENIWKAAPLHDIGKIKISDMILLKPGKLTAQEFEIMKQHTTEGGKLIYDVLDEIEEKKYIAMAHDVALYHHEKWDGTGYPQGLSGEQIPLCARIMAVADVFDALISKRCYKDAMSLDLAYTTIQESAGTHFDPVIVEAFEKIRPQLEEYLLQNV